MMETAHLSRYNNIESPCDATDSQDFLTGDVYLQISLQLQFDETVGFTAKALRKQRQFSPTSKELRWLACRIYEARRTREKHLEPKLFGEPAWDKLLALFHMPARGEMLSVTGLCHASGVALTTALRWQQILRDENLIERGSEWDGRQAPNRPPHSQRPNPDVRLSYSLVFLRQPNAPA